MDPVAHTLTGAALAGAGLRKITPLATATLLLGANAPDIDAVLMFGDDYLALAHRRGMTHGLPAAAVLIVALTCLMLLWDRHIRRRFNPRSSPARASPLLLVTAIGVMSHPVLDWLNNYGMRWLMPFDGRWSYGDALFIIDAWVWLGLGGICFLLWSHQRIALWAWLLFWAATSWLILTTPYSPQPTKVLWTLGIAVLLLLRWRCTHPPSTTSFRLTLAAVTIYMSLSVVANLPARAEVRSVLAAHGIENVEAVMIGPSPGNPWHGHVVAATPQHYHLGEWNWLGNPRFTPTGVIDSHMDEPEVRRATEDPSARRFLTWSRFPFAVLEESEAGSFVRFGDARYPEERGPARGPRVDLNNPAIHRPDDLSVDFPTVGKGDN